VVVCGEQSIQNSLSEKAESRLLETGMDESYLQRNLGSRYQAGFQFSKIGASPIFSESAEEGRKLTGYDMSSNHSSTNLPLQKQQLIMQHRHQSIREEDS